MLAPNTPLFVIVNAPPRAPGQCTGHSRSPARRPVRRTRRPARSPPRRESHAEPSITRSIGRHQLVGIDLPKKHRHRRLRDGHLIVLVLTGASHRDAPASGRA